MSPLVYWRRMIRHVSLLTWVGVRSGLEHRIALAQPVLRLLRALAGHARVEADLHPGIKQNDTYYARRVHVVREKRHTHNSYSFSLASSPWPRRADCSAPTGPSLHRDGGDRGKGEIYLILLPSPFHPNSDTANTAAASATHTAATSPAPRGSPRCTRRSEKRRPAKWPW